MCVLEFDDVSFAYDGTRRILDGASFSVRPGEMVALVGANGSGKSTVAKLAEAFLLPSSGEVRVLGRSVAEVVGPEGADGVLRLRQGLGLVMQNPDDQLVASIVVDEVAFGPSNVGLPRDEVIGRVQDALGRVGMLECIGSNVNTLSGGQKQRVAIADALAMRPRLLIMDEPTSMLDANGRREVREVACALRDAGMAVLWVTHSAEEAALADRVLALCDGQLTEGMPPAPAPDVSASDTPMPPATPAPAPGRPPRASRRPEGPGEPLVAFRDASFSYTGKGSLGIDVFTGAREDAPVFEHVDLELREGEALAVVGPNGCGKSTLLQHMNGLLAPTSGEVVVCGRATGTREGANAARRAVGLCMQFPERSMFCQTVRDEVAFGPRNLGLAGDELDERVREALELVGLSPKAYAARTPFDLSGGEQRKVALAGIVAMRPRVLALDEPCSGLDEPSRMHLVEALAQMRAAGQAMAIVTHDTRDVDALADRVYEMEGASSKR